MHCGLTLVLVLHFSLAMIWLIIEEQDERMKMLSYCSVVSTRIYLNLQLNRLQVDETFVEFRGTNVQASSFEDTQAAPENPLCKRVRCF